MLMLIFNLIYKMSLSMYRFQKQMVMNGKYRYLPKENWKNWYPIVLVHGFAGSAQDQSYLMGNYFEYAIKSSLPYDDVYVAVINPFGGIHDKACELYQQLVGIGYIK